MNSPIKPTRKYTYREYQHFQDNGLRHEIIDGEHYMSPAPSTKHQSVLARLMHILFSEIELKKRGRVFVAPFDVELSEHDIVQPDIVVVMNDRKQAINPKRCLGVPSLAIEILSESNPAHDRVLKFEMYQRSKLPEYWIVDPEDETVEQWCLDGDVYVSIGKHRETFSARTIDDLTIDMQFVFDIEH